MIEIEKKIELVTKVDTTDVFTFGGIGLIAVGTWLLSPPVSLIVTGSLLLMLALAPYIITLKPRK